jgi:hypothetical protein
MLRRLTNLILPGKRPGQNTFPSSRPEDPLALGEAPTAARDVAAADPQARRPGGNPPPSAPPPPIDR